MEGLPRRESAGFFTLMIKPPVPLSLAKAYVILEEVVMIEIAANSRHTSGKISRQTVPALLPVA